MRRILLAIIVSITTLTAFGPTDPVAAAPNIVIFEEGFESGDLSAWDNVNTNRYAITSDPAEIRTGSYALEGTIPEGDGWGEINKWFMPGYDEIYVRFDVMFEIGFQNLRGDGNGMHFASVSGNHIDNKWSSHGKAGIVPSGYDFFTTTVDPEHPYNDPTLRPFMFYSYFPDMNCCYGNLFKQQEPKVETVAGQWHELIIHVDAGTPGEFDGSQQLWIDGQLQIDVQGMRWRDTTDLRVNEFAIVDYMPGSIKTQHIWFDNIFITTEFPGTTVGPPTTFVDVPSAHLFLSDIEWLAATGITRGCNPPTNDRYCPDDPVTRGQMAAFLARALDLPEFDESETFSDDDATPFEQDIERIFVAGITKGCDPPLNDRFCPNDPVTRGQMAAFLVRALDLPSGTTGVFTDVGGSVFELHIEALAEAGITRGCNPPTNDRFCPDSAVSRAEMAAFLSRALSE
ncbi:MAG: S-layer homology domain-containing protein [Actinomycetota bacterium]|nr:S-layer homology domain-containing protein [Actinomycetota bacterium]